MDEMVSCNVFDVVYSSPIPLKELSSIAIAVQLWHLDINQFLEIGNFSEELYESFEAEPRITLRDIIPGIPLAIHSMPEKYAKKLMYSTIDWLCYHFNRKFNFHRDNLYLILKDFNDIVCGHDGTIHYVRTAKKMMLCDRISLDEKFKIACAYSFEEDIKHIGPSVQSKVDLDVVDFDFYPHLYYWTCYLRNEMYKIPNEGCISMDDLMLENTEDEDGSSFEYFWNRASPESRYRRAVRFCMNGKFLFCGRFVLPKLSVPQLTAFVAEKGSDLVYNVLTSPRNKEHAFPIWMYLRDKFEEASFTSLVGRMLQFEIYYSLSKYNVELKKCNYEILQTCCEIWKSAPEFLKKIILNNLHYESLFKMNPLIPSEPRETQLLLKILSESTSPERTTFWLNNWRNLIASTCVSDLVRIMNLCFTNQTEIELFKTTTMAKYENLIEIAKDFVIESAFKELTNLLNFCFPDPQICADFKQRFLRVYLLNEGEPLSSGIILKFESWHDIINDAYADSSELARDFRNELLSSPGTERRLVEFIQFSRHFAHVKPFVQSFELIGHNMDEMKRRLLDKLREYLSAGCIYGINAKHVQDFILWCLGNEDRIIEFKQSISPENVLSNIMLRFHESIRDNFRGGNLNVLRWCYSKTLDQFLLWYFVTPQKIDEFKTKSADVLKMFILPS